MNSKRKQIKQTPTSRQSPVRGMLDRVRRGRLRLARNTPKTFNLDNVLSDITSSLSSSLNKPLVLLSLLTVATLVTTHSTNFTGGVVGSWVKENSASNTVASWINSNQEKFLGIAVFIPTLIASPKNLQMILSFCTLLWVMLVPQASIYEYVLQSLGLHTYFKVKMRETRMFIIVSIAVAYFAGFLKISAFQAVSKSASNATGGE